MTRVKRVGRGFSFLQKSARMSAFSVSEMLAARKGGRVVEGTALEKRHTGNGIESSNLSLSAEAKRVVLYGPFFASMMAEMRSLYP